jgi:hypothetical protein
VGENTKQIKRTIVAERDQLGRNLNELETRAQQFVDWRTHYRNNPKVLLGIAVAGGLVLGAMARRGRSARSNGPFEKSPRRARRTSRLTRELQDTWLRVSDVLLGVASAKVIEFVGSVVPGFSEQVSHSQPGSGFEQ